MSHPLLASDSPPRTLDSARTLAKLIKRTHGISHARALDIVATMYGWKDWQEAHQALELTDFSKKWELRKARKDQRKFRRKFKIAPMFLQRLVRARLRHDAVHAAAVGWRKWRSPTSLVRYSWRPIDGFTARAVFKPYSMD